MQISNCVLPRIVWNGGLISLRYFFLHVRIGGGGGGCADRLILRSIMIRHVRIRERLVNVQNQLFLMIARTQKRSSGKEKKKLDTHLGPFQFVCKAQRGAEDAVDHLLHLNSPGNFAEASLCWFHIQHLFQEQPSPQHPP